MFLDELFLAWVNDAFNYLKRGKSFIEVACVVSFLDHWNVGSDDLLLHQVLDLELLEPGVGDDVFHVVDPAKSLVLVLVQQLADQVLGDLRYFEPMLVLLRPSYLSVLNQVVHLMLVLVVEGWDAYQHLVDENAECPPVQGVVVACAVNHLRSYQLYTSVFLHRYSGVPQKEFAISSPSILARPKSASLM